MKLSKRLLERAQQLAQPNEFLVSFLILAVFTIELFQPRTFRLPCYTMLIRESWQLPSPSVLSKGFVIWVSSMPLRTLERKARYSSRFAAPAKGKGAT